MRLRTLLAAAVTVAGATLAVVLPAAPASAATACASWTDYETGPGYPYRVSIPSITRNGGETSCILSYGNQNNGVRFLRDALNKCYGQGLTTYSTYDGTVVAAVKNVQHFHGIPDDGVYGPQTRAAMVWPKFRQDGTFSHCW